MTITFRVFRLCLIFTAIVTALSGCLKPPGDDSVPSLTATPSPAWTEPVLPPIEPSPSASPAVSLPAALETRGPFWVGRGWILVAEFLPGSSQVAVAWGNGVSLHSVESGREIWFTPTPSNVIAFDVQPQAQKFAAVLTDGSVMIFAAATGEAQTFAGAQPNALWGDLAWSPDGQTIAFQLIGPNRSDPIYLLDVNSGQTSEVPNSQASQIDLYFPPFLFWSPDGGSITLTAPPCARFIDLASGKAPMNVGKRGACYVSNPLLFLPDGQILAVKGPNGGVYLLHYPEGDILRTLKTDAGRRVCSQVEIPAPAMILFVDPGGKWIASHAIYEPCFSVSRAEQTIHLLIVWDLESGAVQARLEQVVSPLPGRRRLAAAFDGESILILYERGEITRWNFHDPQAEETLVAQMPLRPHNFAIIHWSADGNYLAVSGGDGGGAEIYATASQQLIRRFDPPLDFPALSPDGRLAALYDPAQQAEVVFELKNGQLEHTLPASPVWMGAAFSPDGRYLAYGAAPSIMVVDLTTEEATKLEAASVPMVTERMSVTGLIWSPDGQSLATVLSEEGDPVIGGPGVIVLWRRRPDGSFAPVYQSPNVWAHYTSTIQELVVFSPSSSRVALQSWPEPEGGQRELVIYDLQAGKVLNTFPEYIPGAWVNDDVFLAAKTQINTLLASINVVNGAMTAKKGTDYVFITYSPGGRYITREAAHMQGGVAVMDWQTNTQVAFLPYEYSIFDTWSPDGRWLASAGLDGTLRLWELATP